MLASSVGGDAPVDPPRLDSSLDQFLTEDDQVALREAIQAGSGDFLSGSQSHASISDLPDSVQALYLDVVSQRADGSIIVGGYLRLPSPDDAAERLSVLVQFTPGGVLDATFGDSGMIAFDLAWHGSARDGEVPGAISVDARERILILYSRSLVRLKADGQFDPQFGDRGVVAFSRETTGFRSFVPYDVAVTPNDKILVAGRMGMTFNIARFHDDGTIDTTFGDGGLIEFGDELFLEARFTSIELDGTFKINADDRREITIAGDGTFISSHAANGENLPPVAVIRGLEEVAQGSSVDLYGHRSYDGDGIRREGELLYHWDLDGDGIFDDAEGQSVTVSGDRVGSLGEYTASLRVTDSDGVTDTATYTLEVVSPGTTHGEMLKAIAQAAEIFQGEGEHRFKYVNDSNGSWRDIEFNTKQVLADGSILLVGYVTVPSDSPYGGMEHRLAVAKYTADGMLDTTFGTGGLTITDTNSTMLDALIINIVDVELTPDGGFVIAAMETNVHWWEFVLAKYHANGTADQDFGDDGVSKTFLSELDAQVPSGDLYATMGDRVRDIEVLADGSIMAVGGGYDHEAALIVAHFHANGTRNEAFGVRGVAQIYGHNIRDARIEAIDESGTVSISAVIWKGVGVSGQASYEISATGELIHFEETGTDNTAPRAVIESRFEERDGGKWLFSVAPQRWDSLDLESRDRDLTVAWDLDGDGEFERDRSWFSPSQIDWAAHPDGIEVTVRVTDPEGLSTFNSIWLTPELVGVEISSAIEESPPEETPNEVPPVDEPPIENPEPPVGIEEPPAEVPFDPPEVPSVIVLPGPRNPIRIMPLERTPWVIGIDGTCVPGGTDASEGEPESVNAPVSNIGPVRRPADLRHAALQPTQRPAIHPMPLGSKVERVVVASQLATDALFADDTKALFDLALLSEIDALE